MATYNLRDAIPSRLSAGDILNYPFRKDESKAFQAVGSYGGTISLTLPKGRYKLEVWGSSAYPDHEDLSVDPIYKGKYWEGPGGYASGELTLQQNTVAYLTAGGVGTNGGWSHASDYHYASQWGSAMRGSGGASDIRLLANDTYHRVIVAGGGGEGRSTYGAWYPGTGEYSGYGYARGGGGGGLTGGDAPVMEEDYARYFAKGATQTAGGASGECYNGATPTTRYTSIPSGFGVGGVIKSKYQTYEEESVVWADGSLKAGGGGWYGGGSGGIFDEYYSTGGWFEVYYFSAGGGGSGFTYSQATQGSVPTGYALDRNYWLTNTVNINGIETNTNITNPDGTTSKGRYGEGYVRITVLDIISGLYIGSSASKALAVKNIYIGDSSGKARKVIKGYIGDANGKARRFL